VRVPTPPLEEIKKEFDDLSWGGRVSLRKDYFLPVTDTRRGLGRVILWHSSWEKSLDEAIEHCTPDSSYWITLIYRSSDNRGRYKRMPQRYIGYVKNGEFHLFPWIMRFKTAGKRVFKEMGWEVHEPRKPTVKKFVYGKRYRFVEDYYSRTPLIGGVAARGTVVEFQGVNWGNASFIKTNTFFGEGFDTGTILMKPKQAFEYLEEVGE